MKIVFSIYLEEDITGRVYMQYSDVVETDLSIKQIDERLQLYDLFHSELVVGHNLSFWDIYFWESIPVDIINKIKSIPKSYCNSKPYCEPRRLCISEFDPGNTDSAFYPDINNCYFFRVSRYERGASGLGAIIAESVAFPIIINIVSSFIYSALCLLFQRKHRNMDTKQKFISLNVRNFWKNFCKSTNLDMFSCQMIFLSKLENGKCEIHVRTIRQECYRVVCNSKGVIKSLKLIDICRDGCE